MHGLQTPAYSGGNVRFYVSIGGSFLVYSPEVNGRDIKDKILLAVSDVTHPRTIDGILRGDLDGVTVIGNTSVSKDREVTTTFSPHELTTFVLGPVNNLHEIKLEDILDTCLDSTPQKFVLPITYSQGVSLLSGILYCDGSNYYLLPYNGQKRRVTKDEARQLIDSYKSIIPTLPRQDTASVLNLTLQQYVPEPLLNLVTTPQGLRQLRRTVGLDFTDIGDGQINYLLQSTQLPKPLIARGKEGLALCYNAEN